MMKKVNQLFPENSVDIVFAGHNHQYTNGLVGKTRIVQALSQGKAYADVRGVLDTDTQDFIETPSAKVIAVAPGKKQVVPIFKPLLTKLILSLNK